MAKPDDREAYKDGDKEYNGVTIGGMQREGQHKRISRYTSRTAKMLDDKIRQADAAAHRSEGK